MNSWLGRIVFLASMLSVLSLVAPAQQGKSLGSMKCGDNWSGRDQESFCEIREQTVPAVGAITVEPSKNGGVAVKGWDRNDVLVRSRVQTSAPTQSEAAQLAKQISIEAAGGKISASGPSFGENSHWSVSYEIFAPRRTDLSLQAYNGGISISDVSGRIEFTGHNGGVVLRRVGGNVRGGTTNGGVVVELAGDRWDGETLDVRTTNGGIVMSVPENYSAHLETSTVNGHLSIDFPVTVQGRITKELAVNLGAGGPTVRATTTNGGVRIKRLESGSNN